MSNKILHGKEYRRSYDISGCLSGLSVHYEEVAKSLYALGDRHVHSNGRHRGIFTMVQRVYGTAFTIPSYSCEHRKFGDTEARQADTQAFARIILLWMLAALRDWSVRKDT